MQNLDADAIMNYVNVECWGFTLGLGLDRWVNGMLPMAAHKQHIIFLDAVMQGVVLPAVTNEANRTLMEDDFQRAAIIKSHEICNCEEEREKKAREDAAERAEVRLN